MSFKKPDDATIKRMTVQSATQLINALQRRRDAVVKPLDAEIQFYEKVLKQKQKEDEHGTTTGTV